MLINMDIQHPEMDCDFYYFKPRGKWKYHGEGMFPDNGGVEGWYEVDHDAIFKMNSGMPGITNDGKHMTIVIIPRGNCKVKSAHPQMIKAMEHPE